MENIRFNLHEDDVRISVDKNHKVTLYVINKDKTRVKTLDEFINNKPGHEIISVSPRAYRKKLLEIKNKYDKLKSSKIFKNEKFLTELENEKQTEIDKLLEPVKKLLKNDKISDIKDYGFLVSDYSWIDKNGHVISNFIFCIEPASVLKDNNDIVLGRYNVYRPKVFKTFDDLKKYEQEWQNDYDEYFEDARQEKIEKENTEELLNF